MKKLKLKPIHKKMKYTLFENKNFSILNKKMFELHLKYKLYTKIGLSNNLRANIEEPLKFQLELLTFSL